MAGTPPGPSLVPGPYEPVSGFETMIGCPMNGEWEFSAVDLWGADNGFLCGWAIEFAQPQPMDTSTQQASFGIGCDSSYWSGPNLQWLSTDCDSAVFSSGSVGVYDLQYTVVDEFGCVSDTVVNITVIDPLTLSVSTE